MKRSIHGVRAAAAAAALVALAACDGTPTGTPPPPPPPPCQLPGGAGGTSSVSAEGLRLALADAGNRMTLGLTPAERAALAERLQGLGASLNGSADAACQALRATHQALDALPDASATRPDRTGIRLVLELTAAHLRER